MEPDLTFRLAGAPLGLPLRIRRLRSAGPLRLRLRELGFREGGLVRCVLRTERSIVCEVGHSRYGMNREAAWDIEVSHAPGRP
ncbi:MAG: FeoA family protein [Bacteroidota bacterium]